MKTLLSLVTSFIVIHTVPAQEKISTITLTDTLVSVAIDRPGDFYIVTSGEIQRFDKDGKLSLLYKAETVPALFDPRDGARLFAYYRHDQHYELLSPSFEPMATYQIDPSFAIQPWLACPSGEYKLWILDQADRSLKKVNTKTSEVEVEVVVDSSLIQKPVAVTTMRDYQGFVFLLIPAKGLLIFNGLGKHIKTLDIPGVDAFNFLGEELYYVRGDNIEFLNLFTTETRSMKIPAGYWQALLTDERMILVAHKKIDIFPFSP